MVIPLAAYTHREVPLEFAGRRLSFATSLALFSSHQVDVGSRLLLRTLDLALADRPAEDARILDLGCGYGALGIALAALSEVASVDLVDRDALAVDFARENARRNGVEACVTAFATLGLDDLPPEARYDLVVSNLPGKAGSRVIASMLLDPLGLLRPGGFVAVVVIEPIRDLVASTLARPDVEVTLRRDTADYSVFHYRPAPGAPSPPPPSGFEAGVYDHGVVTFDDAAELPITIRTVEGLPSYDRVDVMDLTLAGRLPRLVSDPRVLITNVGQGALPAAVLRAQPTARFLLVDRDLLALRTARRALLDLGCPDDRIETHLVGAWDVEAMRDARADLAIGALHEDGGAAAVTAEYAGIIEALAPGGHAVLAGSSTAVTRLLGHALPPGMRASRTRHRGTSFLEVTRGA